MAKHRHKPLSEEKTLKQIREDYSREECIQIWYEIREGARSRFPSGFRQKHAHRKYVIEAFVEEFKQKQISDLEEIIESGEDEPVISYPTVNDFVDNKLSGMLQYYDASPYDAFVAIGFTNPESENYDPVLDKAPWLVMSMLPNKYWKIKKNRIKAAKWLVGYLNKPVTAINRSDFIDNSLKGLLTMQNESPYKVLKEVYPNLEETDMLEVPHHFWKDEKNFRKAIIKVIKENNGVLPTSVELHDDHTRISHAIYRYPEIYGDYKAVKEKYEALAKRS